MQPYLKINHGLLLLTFLFIGININAQVTTDYWPNKKKRSIGEMVDSIKLGAWQYWNENGTPSDSGSYVKLTSEQIRVYVHQEYIDKYKIDTLKIKQKDATSRKYTETGKWIIRSEKGIVIETGEYLPMASITLDFILDENNEEIYVYTASEPIKIGMWKHYNENGKLAVEQEYIVGDRYGYGMRIEYYQNGIKKQEGIFHEKHEHWSGPVKFYDEKGKLFKVITYTEHGEEFKVENY